MNARQLSDAVCISENKVRVSLEQMLEEGLIEAYGNGTSRSYTLGRRVYSRRERDIQYVRQTDIERVRYPELVMKLARQQGGRVTKQDVVELLHVTPSQAYSVLKKMTAEGDMISSGAGKYAYYQIADNGDALS